LPFLFCGTITVPLTPTLSQTGRGCYRSHHVGTG